MTDSICQLYGTIELSRLKFSYYSLNWFVLWLIKIFFVSFGELLNKVLLSTQFAMSNWLTLEIIELNNLLDKELKMSKGSCVDTVFDKYLITYSFRHRLDKMLA